MSIYDDDILAAGRPYSLKKFWAQLSKHIEIEAPSEVDRFLGRYHRFLDSSTVLLHMGEYAQHAIDLYTSLPGAKPLKGTDSPPYVAEGSLPLEDWQVKGEVSQNSAKILMKLLWYSRLCRPDLAHAISALAAQSTIWSKNADKQTHKLMCYVLQTIDVGLRGVVKDPLRDCVLDHFVFVDADLAGCPHTAKSTSGLWLQISGPKGTQFPRAWSSRRQGAVSRSTTEAEMISLAEGLFVEALPVQDLLSKVAEHVVPLVVHEDNEAVIKVIEAGYSVKLRGLLRTHKLSIASVSDFIKTHKNEVLLKYTNTKEQLADLFTKALARLPFQDLARRLGLTKVPAS